VTRGRIYLMDGSDKPKAFNVRLGISDGTSTELIVSPNSPGAELFTEGALVVTSTVSAANATSSAPRPTGPRIGF
jgi:HlyD family secretion protein